MDDLLSTVPFLRLEQIYHSVLGVSIYVCFLSGYIYENVFMRNNSCSPDSTAYDTSPEKKKCIEEEK